MGLTVRGLMVAALLFAPPVFAQRYSTRPDPRSPDAFDREQARVRPGLDMAFLGGAAADAALSGGHGTTGTSDSSKPPRPGLTRQDQKAIDSFSRELAGLRRHL